MYLVGQMDVDMEFETARMMSWAKGLQSDGGEAKVHLQVLYRVPGYCKTCLQHPLLAVVEVFQIFLFQSDTVLLQLVIHVVLEVPGYGLKMVMFNTEPETGVSEQRSKIFSLQVHPAFNGEVHKHEKFFSVVNSKLSCSWRVCMHLPDRVPAADKDVVKSNLLAGEVVYMGKLIL